jgi:hypothetical protein
VSTSDFSNLNFGQSTWFGAKAFVTYLNSISYAGSNLWALPTAGANPQALYNQANTQFGDLFYNELNGTAGGAIPNTSYFTNVHTSGYWLGTEYGPTIPYVSWSFITHDGYQGGFPKDTLLYAWAVSPGNVATIPVPGALWLFSTGILGFLGLRRRGNIE